MDKRTCSIDGCGGSVSARGWCKRHYTRWWRTGDPLAVRTGGDPRVRLESQIDRSAGDSACHPWRAGQTPDGYGRVGIGGRGRWKPSHVALWELENGPKPAGSQLDHECHNRAVREGDCRPGKCPHRLCCNLRHIVLRLSKDEHFSATVPWERNERENNAKLTRDQVLEIRKLVADGKPASLRTDLAERYGVSTMQIYRIATGKAWAWL